MANRSRNLSPFPYYLGIPNLCALVLGWYLINPQLWVIDGLSPNPLTLNGTLWTGCTSLLALILIALNFAPLRELRVASRLFGMTLMVLPIACTLVGIFVAPYLFGLLFLIAAGTGYSLIGLVLLCVLPFYLVVLIMHVNNADCAAPPPPREDRSRLGQQRALIFDDGANHQWDEGRAVDRQD